MTRAPVPVVADKVPFLSRPEAFPDGPESVAVVETHFAWVFLSRRYVYKLKKPARFPGVDLRTPEARRANCELEIALNRRLAAETYIGIVPLGMVEGRLCLECDENPVDWLVKMRRLRREAALEHLLPRIDLMDPRLERLINVLCEFYEDTYRAAWDTAAYVRSLKRRTARYASELKRPALAPEAARVDDIAMHQARFVDGHPEFFDQRIVEKRVVDAHGDLRPEHIFLMDDHPQIIDCLEFSAELRQLDTAEEISFLALECERLGRPTVGDRFRELYVKAARDDAPAGLFDYYRSQRALIRAALSVWRLTEDLDDAEAQHWLERARWYIRAAHSSITQAS